MSNTLSPILSKLAGKNVHFAGRFDRIAKRRLVDLTEAHQGTLAEKLDASVHFLVIADLAAGKTAQKQALSLNAKGAAIQVLDGDAFHKLFDLAPSDFVQLIRGGSANAARFNRALGTWGAVHSLVISGETFDGLDLRGFRFMRVSFEHCTFVGSTLSKVYFSSATDCDFSKAVAEAGRFGDVTASKFREATLPSTVLQGDIARADFTSAQLESATISFHRFTSVARLNHRAPGPMDGVVFANAILRSTQLTALLLNAPDFANADLEKASMTGCTFSGANFRGANLTAFSAVGCRLPQADLTGANCQSANFADADFTDAKFDGADLADCIVRGANLSGADLSTATHYDPNAAPAPTVGPALTELDTLIQTARRICVTFRVRADPTEDGVEVGIDSAGLKWGYGVRFPPGLLGRQVRQNQNQSFSAAMLLLANALANRKVRYETVEVESSKSPKGGKELRELAINAVAEAFAQPIPPAAELATASKVYRAQLKEKSAVDRERREKAKKLAAQQQATAKRQIAVKIAKTVGSVTDVGTFLKALELRADKSKIDKATKMLKAEKFQLFKDIADTHLNGVVKSQTDADLVYACRIEPGGKYACCTQNLNICGGLRGSICKHLLVLIIGLVKSGELDPTTIDTWIAKTHDAKPELDKEIMGEIFIRYKGAEAGEVDWRPTETVPEDYYAL